MVFFDIRDKFVEIRYEKIYMIVKPTKTKYFVNVDGKYDYYPHIEVRFINNATKETKWFIMPQDIDFKDTIEEIFHDLEYYFCKKKPNFINILPERIYIRIENGEFDKILNCETVKGLEEAFNAVRNQGVKNLL